jgi:Putative zinc-finger
MEKMDHNQAIQLQAAVKYVLGELSQVQREEYEEHYFDCAECAVDLQALATFADTTREVLRQEKASALAAEPVPARSGWLRWLQPVTAVPVFAALLLVIGYQSFIAIPQAKKETTPGASLFLFNSYPLRGVNTAGEEGRTLSIQPDEAFFLNFDFVPTRSFDSYVGQLENAEGRVILRAKIAGGNANQEAHLPIPGGMLHPGKYVLAFYGDPGGGGKVDARNDAGRLPFTVEFRP